VQIGAGAIDKLPDGIKKDQEAVAETIVNNMRRLIIDEHATNPKYYDKMSEFLDALIEERRKQALEYKDYLARLLEQATKLAKGESDTTYPDWADNGDPASKYRPGADERGALRRLGTRVFVHTVLAAWRLVQGRSAGR
jgi:hypothetical protein